MTAPLYILAISAMTRLAGWGVEIDASATMKKLTEFFGKTSCAMLVAFASLAYGRPVPCPDYRCWLAYLARVWM